jgi:phosphoglycolate phosphatase
VPLVVGFDLDMTLIDSRPGIRAVWAEVVARTGAPIDPDVAVTRLGPPVERELAQ